MGDVHPQGNPHVQLDPRNIAAVAKVDAGQAQALFWMNPTRIEQVRAVAAVGEKMPQKSTYFYPKLLTGLVFHALQR